jgi:vancomycin resistance protein YoaR
MRRLLAVGGIVLGSGLGVAAGLALHRYVPEGPLVRGLAVGDRTVTEKNARAALERARAEALARPVYFVHEGALYSASQRELGVELDVDATLLEARAVGHQGGLVRRLRESEQARRGEVTIPFTWRFDPAKARAFLDRLASVVEKAPVDARLDLKTFQKIPDQPGEALDVGATLRRIEQAPRDLEATITLAVEPTSAKVTVADLGDIDPSKVLSSHETTFATYGTGVGRSQNIRNAAAKIDGVVIAPGQVFSFNERVGARTLENGFAYAPEIQGDEMTTGVGGGTCQVSSTLHIAALFGALQIVERQSHSRPSAYTQLGLDATVSYPKVDLKLRNNMPFPVIVHAVVPEQTEKQKKTNTAAIRVELLRRRAPRQGRLQARRRLGRRLHAAHLHEAALPAWEGASTPEGHPRLLGDQRGDGALVRRSHRRAHVLQRLPAGPRGAVGGPGHRRRRAAPAARARARRRRPEPPRPPGARGRLLRRMSWPLDAAPSRPTAIG